MPNRPLSPGDVVEARCTRCMTVMNHTIVAMVEGRIVRVECNTCHGEHNFRSALPRNNQERKPGIATPRSTAPTRQTKKIPQDTDRQEWLELCAGLQPEKAAAYAMDGVYRIGDVVCHPTFGLGIVRMAFTGKAEILFQDGKKLLKCQ